MAGVASPMLRRTRSAGSRFLVGLVVGGVAAGIILSVPAYLVGTIVHEFVPERWRLVVLAGLLAGLGVADLLRRTPHVWRQVPQRLVWTLPPGTLGLAWGFDLGLLFTTQKTTSLVWVAMAAVVLLGPSLSAVVLVSIAVVASLAIAVWSVSGWTDGLAACQRDRRWQGLLQQGSGLVILALCTTTLLQAWNG
jgi:hypothetical protein